MGFCCDTTPRPGRAVLLADSGGAGWMGDGRRVVHRDPGQELTAHPR